MGRCLLFFTIFGIDLYCLSLFSAWHFWGEDKVIGIGYHVRCVTEKPKGLKKKRQGKATKKCARRKKESCSGTSKVSITRNKGPRMDACISIVGYSSVYSPCSNLQSNPQSWATVAEGPWARLLNSPTAHCQLGPIFPAMSLRAGAGREQLQGLF